MLRVDDQILMAYADSGLGPNERLRVEALLQIDSEARRRVSQFRCTADILRHAFDEPMWAAPPPRLINTIMPASDSSQLLWLAARRRNWRTRIAPRIVAIGMATAAAGLALSFGLQWSPDPGAVALGNVPAGSQLERVLESYHNGDEPSGTARFQLVAKLRDRHGRACHEVDRFAAGDRLVPTEVIVACKQGAGRWIVVGAVAPRGHDRTKPYVEDEVAAHEAMSSVLRMIGATQRATHLKPESRDP